MRSADSRVRLRAGAEPEREMVRRGIPFMPPAVLLALVIGAVAAGWNVGWSAAIGVAIVSLNFIANGLSLARAARVSLTALTAVALGGFVVRLAVIVAIMAALNQFGWFSPVAFGLAVVPATILLLAFEMRLVARGIGADLRLDPLTGRPIPLPGDRVGAGASVGSNREAEVSS